MSESDRHLSEPEARVAVLLPCYNEASAIKDTVLEFRRALPRATIYVFDNNSTDGTGEVAREAGAVVRFERQRGKGNVVCRMFADVEADYYIMADGDGTYAAEKAGELLDILRREDLDMVVGAREGEALNERPGHAMGNALFNMLLKILFQSRFSDIFSGYRVFSRRFVKSFPALSSGFEIETEMSVHAHYLSIPTREIKLPFRERPEGSVSKLRTFRDGFKILMTMLLLMKEVRPFLFFSIIACAFFLASALVGAPVVVEFFETGLVPRFPSAILAMGLAVLGFIGISSGIVLDSVARGRREAKRMIYLGLSKSPVKVG